jgi:hypothetical protein
MIKKEAKIDVQIKGIRGTKIKKSRGKRNRGKK